MLIGVLPLMSVAAVLEAGVARAADATFSPEVKLGVAGLFALLFFVYTLLLGWKAPRATEPPT